MDMDMEEEKKAEGEGEVLEVKKKEKQSEPEVKEDLFNYKCKQCPAQFKITAEFQRHMRHTHGHGNGKTNGNGSSNDQQNMMEQMEASSSSSLKKLKADGVVVTNRQLLQLCRYCNYEFDTNDPVMWNIVRFSRKEDGSFKCPFCIEVHLTKVKTTGIKLTPLLLRLPSPTSPPRPNDNLSARRRKGSFQKRIQECRALRPVVLVKEKRSNIPGGGNADEEEEGQWKVKQGKKRGRPRKIKAEDERKKEKEEEEEEEGEDDLFTPINATPRRLSKRQLPPLDQRVRRANFLKANNLHHFENNTCPF